MMRPGTFERVYAAIKQQLRSGSCRPGERLDPALLADQFDSSVTPVRNALHRLTGERLVEAPHDEGFRAPLLTENALRHLYAWHHDLVLLAIASHESPPAPDYLSDFEPGTGEPHQRLNRLFLELARATGNPEHLMALQSLTERVEPAQRLEDVLLSAAEEETAHIFSALKSNDRRELRKALVHYHRRRSRIVPEIIEQLYWR